MPPSVLADGLFNPALSCLNAADSFFAPPPPCGPTFPAMSAAAALAARSVSIRGESVTAALLDVACFFAASFFAGSFFAELWAGSFFAAGSTDFFLAMRKSFPCAVILAARRREESLEKFRLHGDGWPVDDNVIMSDHRESNESFDPRDDPMAPPRESCECYCLHCQRTFMSDEMWFQRVIGDKA